MEYVTKLTTKKIGVQPGRNEKPELGKTVVVATLIGIARSYKAGSSEYGEFLKFAGDFEATRVSDGETFRSARAIFPAIFADSLQTAIDSDTDHNGVQFAAELGVRGAENAVGYEWTIRPIGNVSGNADPLAALRDEAVKALPAPESSKKSKK